jgi:ADP-heptose:LPS heptosyltransferase
MTGGMRTTQRFFKDIERLGKRCLISLARVVFRSPDEQAFDATQCHCILVVRQDNRLGNLVLIEPFLRALRRGFPQAKLTLICGEAFSELYAPGILVDEVIVFPHMRFAKNPLRFPPWLRSLRRRLWDLAIDSAHPRTISTTNLLLVTCSGARWRLGFAREGSERFLNLTVRAPSPASYVEEQFLLLQPLGIESEVSPPHFSLPPGHEILSRQFRRELNLREDERICGLWIGGRYDKRWDLREFISLYRHFEEERPRQFCPVLLFGPDEDLKIPPEIRHHRFTGPIWELAAALKTLSWFLSTDSGPRHLAVALGIPSIGLFRYGAHTEYGHADEKNHFDFSVDHEPDISSKVLSAVKMFQSLKIQDNPAQVSSPEISTTAK